MKNQKRMLYKKIQQKNNKINYGYLFGAFVISAFTMGAYQGILFLPFNTGFKLVIGKILYYTIGFSVQLMLIVGIYNIIKYYRKKKNLK